MEFGKRNQLVAAATALGICLTFAGCSESEAYIDYSSLEALKDTVEQKNGSQSADGTPARATTATERDSDKAALDEQPADRPGTSEPQDETADAQTPVADPQTPTEASPKESESTDPADGVAKSVEQSSDAAQAPDLPLADKSDQPAEPREIKLLIPEKRFRAEGDSKSLRVSYDDIDLLKVLNMEPVPVDATKHFPKWLSDLHGQRIRIRGFMYPTFEATGLTGFVLARDNQICCFGRNPLVYDLVEVHLGEGETTDYIQNKPFDVEGVFEIAPEVDDTELFQLYRITDAKVLK